MEASLQDRGGIFDRRFPAAWLALVLTLLMPLQVRTEASLRGTPAASLFELARPRDVLTADQRKLMQASRGRMLQLLALVTDPGNPLELQADARGTARVHLESLSHGVDRLLGLQVQATQEVTARDVQVHLGFMRDPSAHRLLSDPVRDLRRELRRVYPGGEPEAEPEVPEPIPTDPGARAYSAWKRSLGDGSADIGGDPFLHKRLLHLATVRLARHRQGDAPPDRLVRSVLAAEDAFHDCARDWAILFRVVAAASPAVVEYHGGVPEPAFEDFAAELRRSVLRFR